MSQRCRVWSRRLQPGAFAVVLLVLFLTAPLVAGGFLGVEVVGNEDLIMHPYGYDGTGGTLTVTVCIDPATSNDGMVTPVKNIINTYNLLLPIQPNLFSGGDNNVGSSEVDFESVAIHEVGHCLGLLHPNLATESGVGCADASSCDNCDSNYTKGTKGTDSSYDLSDGSDNIIGSKDDLRNDDVNLHWYRKSNNNPFTLGQTVDSSTYSRALSDLPDSTHEYAANAERCVGAALGVSDSEAVMQQGTFGDEEQRELLHDDVATLRYGMSGLDETEGSADDYTIHLEYDGRKTGCDIDLDFDSSETGFAVCKTTFSQINPGSDHWALTEGNAFFHPSAVTWFFNTCEDQLLENDTEPGPKTIEACRYVIGGENFIVDGDVTFRAGRSVILTDGFQVNSGSSFTAEIDTSLDE